MLACLCGLLLFVLLQPSLVLQHVRKTSSLPVLMAFLPLYHSFDEDAAEAFGQGGQKFLCVRITKPMMRTQGYLTLEVVPQGQGVQITFKGRDPIQGLFQANGVSWTEPQGKQRRFFLRPPPEKTWADVVGGGILQQGQQPENVGSIMYCKVASFRSLSFLFLFTHTLSLSLSCVCLSLSLLFFLGC